MPDLRCPFAAWRPGPADKYGYTDTINAPKRGETKHSAEGGWGGLYSVLDGPVRSSWHFTVGYDRIEQHYPLDANCWHGNDTDDDGGVKANIDLVGVEHLGKAGEPLTPFQVEATVKLTVWMAQQYGFGRYARYPVQAGVWTLTEHNQIGNSATACPSNRIPWTVILDKLKGTTPPPPPTPVDPSKTDVTDSFWWYTYHKQAGSLRDISDFNWGVFASIHDEIRRAKGK